MNDDQTVQALQMGHSIQTERWFYGISPDALQSASEDILPLFLDASIEWQIKCGVVPGGLTLPYFSAKMESFQHPVSQRIIKSDHSNNGTGHWVQILLKQIDQLEKTLHSSQNEALCSVTTAIASVSSDVDTPSSLEPRPQHWLQVLLERIDRLEKALQSPQTKALGTTTANVSLVNVQRFLGTASCGICSRCSLHLAQKPRGKVENS